MSQVPVRFVIELTAESGLETPSRHLLNSRPMSRRRFLAIDYGDRRVGIALADGDVPIAFPRETIDREKTDLWVRLAEILKADRVTDVVVGWPVHPDGRPDGKHVDVQKFIDEFCSRHPLLPVSKQDESYSSAQVLQATSHFKKKEKRDKGRVDRAAAAVILQRFLDQEFPS